MEERFICDRCLEEFDISEQYAFDEGVYCPDCIDEVSVVCTHCGERIPTNGNAGTDEIPLCSVCASDYYCYCENCGRLIANEYAYYLDDDEDTPYCYECYIVRKDCTAIHAYGYKPEPIFYGEGDRYFGIELEIDDAGKDSANARQLLNVANDECTHVYIKSDSSLNDGMEIVTHPMSMEYHQYDMPWKDILDCAREIGYKSHDTGTCGLHIHVSRRCLGQSYEEQERRIARILYFVEHHWLELLKFSRRSETQMKRWASRYGYKNTPQEILNTAKAGSIGRYACVNIQNHDTIEFRMFRGTLKYSTLIATLQLVNEICDAAIFYAEEDLSCLSWFDFVERIDHPELIAYLKQRRLYINDPVECEEDL
ncbi:MAG TPA: amidoligase family protein [Negativicutes bacterium]|nr:amidoligase family protein [Negativicutes bacterium]